MNLNLSMDSILPRPSISDDRSIDLLFISSNICRAFLLRNCLSITWSVSTESWLILTTFYVLGDPYFVMQYFLVSSFVQGNAIWGLWNGYYSGQSERAKQSPKSLVGYQPFSPKSTKALLGVLARVRQIMVFKSRIIPYFHSFKCLERSIVGRGSILIFLLYFSCVLNTL